MIVAHRLRRGEARCSTAASWTPTLVASRVGGGWVGGPGGRGPPAASGDSSLNPIGGRHLSVARGYCMAGAEWKKMVTIVHLCVLLSKAHFILGSGPNSELAFRTRTM